MFEKEDFDNEDLLINLVAKVFKEITQSNIKW